MDIHEAYHTIKSYFNEPGAQLSQEGVGNCYYRHPDDGRKCAVGCLIKDSEYYPEMEGAQSESLGFFDGGELSDFVADAQLAHDYSESVAEFLAKLDKAYSKHTST